MAVTRTADAVVPGGSVASAQAQPGAPTSFENAGENPPLIDLLETAMAHWDAGAPARAAADAKAERGEG